MIQIITPATNRMLTTLDAVYARGVVDEDTADDNAVEAMIRSASAAVERYCGRVFARETVKETFRVCSAQVLQLSRLPVTSVTSVTMAGDTIDSDDYEFDSETGAIYKLYGDYPAVWAGKIEITYVGGYILPTDINDSAATLPADVEEAVISMVGSVYASQSTATTGAVRAEEVDGLGRIEYATSTASQSAMSFLVGDVQETLRHYRILQV